MNKKVLYIKANAKPAGESNTFKLADHFVTQYQKENPEDQIVEIDLYQSGINFIQGEDLAVTFGPKTEASKTHHVLKHAYQFAEADKYIFAAPMWNLGLPAIVKAYIDYVSVPGVSFAYTEQGPKGLLQNKKAILLTSRGGSYGAAPGADYEMGERYLKTILGFFGVTDVTAVAAENLSVQGLDHEGIIAQALQMAEVEANRF